MNVLQKRRLYLKMDVLHHSVLLDVFISPFQGLTRGKKGVKSVTFLLVECFLGCQGPRSHLDLFSLKDVDLSPREICSQPVDEMYSENQFYFVNTVYIFIL